MSDTATRTIEVVIDEGVARATDSPGFGGTASGFVAKPFARVLGEKLSLARSLFGDDLDLTSGSVMRKLLELTALEDTRTWAALAAVYDDSFVPTATGASLSRLGEELGLPRPHLAARGRVKLTLADEPATRSASVTIPRGARMTTAGGHHVATAASVTLSVAQPEEEVDVVAFYPGPGHNLDPAAATPDGETPQRISGWNDADVKLAAAFPPAAVGGRVRVEIEHTRPLSGGEQQWPDERYRTLLLDAPRSVWTVDAVRTAVSLVPGVRQVQVRDSLGGLDINQPIFGNFSFVERVFGTERDLGSPYYFTVLVAPTAAAIWEGPDGLRVQVESAVEDLRPVSIFPRVEAAVEVAVGVEAEIVVEGVPLAGGSRRAVNRSRGAELIKRRILDRVRDYVGGLGFGEPVRAARVVRAMTDEPSVVDVRRLKLLRYPPKAEAEPIRRRAADRPDELDCGRNMDLGSNQIAALVEDESRLEIV